jgi:Kae1-associated kinase Bud32
MGDESVPLWKPSKMIHQGAEATVFSGYWMGEKAIFKKRNHRSYRHPDLDRRLTRQRLSVEVRVLRKLHSTTVPSPSLFDVDIDEGWIILSEVEGVTLYESLLNGESNIEHIKKFGGLIRQLHELGISHGDLTTHNVMINDDGELTLIDFGLSKISPEIEHLGLDLQVLHECLNASHYEEKSAIESMIDGYLSNSSDSITPSGPDVIERFNSIRGRVRYHA